jgi:hypothetical protein
VVPTFQVRFELGHSFLLRNLLVEEIVHSFLKYASEEGKIWVTREDLLELVHGAELGSVSQRGVGEVIKEFG